jgi:hypothetical protein
LLRKLLALAAAAALASVLAGSAWSLSRPQVFSLLDVSESFRPLGGFTFERAPQAGDRFALTDGLYRWAGAKRGARLGRLEVLCTFQTVGTARATSLCTGQAFLPAGTVLVEGYLPLNFDGPSKFTLPVVGGTGGYANARGYVRIRDLGNGNSDKSNIDFHLLP